MPPELTTDDPNREQRRYRRVDLFQEVVCESGDVEARSHVADVSVGGMFVDMPDLPFTRGTRVTTRFALRPDEPRMVVDADVHYVQDGIGMGVRFADLRDEDREWIAAFVEESARRKGLGGTPLRKSACAGEGADPGAGAHTNSPPFDERTSIITLNKHGPASSRDGPRRGDEALPRPPGLVFEQRRLGRERAARSEGQVGGSAAASAIAGFQFSHERREAPRYWL
jgi:hypothetical protein